MLLKSKLILILLVIPAILLSQSESDKAKLKLLSNEKKISFLDSLLDVYQYKNPKTAIYYAKELIKISQESDLNDSIKGLGYHELGYAFKLTANFDSAIIAYNIAVDYYGKAGLRRQIALIYSNLGGLYNDKSNYSKSYEYHIKEKQIFTDLMDSSNLALTYYRLGNLEINMENQKKALNYFFQSEKLCKIFNKEGLLSNVYNNIGVVYDYLNEIDKSLEYHKKSLEINRKNNNEVGITYSTLNISEIMLKKEDYESALKNFLEVRKYSESAGLKIPLLYSLRGIGNINFMKNNFRESINYLTQAINIAKSINSNFELRDCYSALSETYEKMNDHINALKYYKIYTDYKDSVMNTEILSKVNELETQYETSKKEKENELLKAELAYKNEIQIYYVIILVMGSVFIILSIFWIRKISNTNRQLKELNATKDKFFTIIAHDLKNPFSTLMGFSKMLEEDFKENTDEENVAALSALYESSRSGFKLLENLLDWSKSQTGALKFNPIKLNLREIADSIIKLLNQTANSKNIKLESYIDANVFVNADEEMISTTLRNIISNALKFTNSGGNVEIFAENKNGDVEIRIKDNGVGIKKEDLDKLFKLEQHHTTPGTNLEKGTGLGLIICKEFVEKNSGTILVESMPGIGTEFKIKLPSAN